MNKKLFIPAIAVFFVSFIVFTALMNPPSDIADGHQYVGVSKCAMCHKGDSKGNQYEIWQGSKHSQAFTDLQTPAADQIAKDKGYQTPAAETPQCIKCHVLGKDIDPSELTDSFDKTQGVQCETCHGPGSDYKSLSVMKDKDKSVANGLVIHTEGAAFCQTCHNSDSPTFKSFDYDSMWAKIKHPDPNLTK
jgi:excinuclease UvrABC ATPase subunit